ncbi:MAG: TMEM198/TM7SF3 family protein [Thermomicrobiales bacterium]|nr:TMEM198/TM7SF3 family protein [Thermomicrobiales bacterium]
MGDIIIGLALITIGLVGCLLGLRVFFVALPIIGFVAGFFVGAAGIAAIAGDSFLANTTGVIVGFIVGLVFAAVSYFFWYFGALLSAAASGALLGSALMEIIGVSSGVAVFLVAAAVALVFFIGAMVLALPIYVVIINTAFAGAAGIVTGLLLLFNQIDRIDLNYGLAWATVEESWFWMIAWIVLTVIGILYQMQSIASVKLPEDRWTQAQQPA